MRKKGMRDLVCNTAVLKNRAIIGRHDLMNTRPFSSRMMSMNRNPSFDAHLLCGRTNSEGDSYCELLHCTL